MGLQLFILIIAFICANWFKETGPEQNCRRQRKYYITIMMSIFVLQSGLRRHDIGPDTGGYERMFYDTIYSSWSNIGSQISDFFDFNEGKDPFFYVLMKLFGEIFPSYQLFLIFIAILFFTALGQILYKYLHSNQEIMVALSLYQCLFYSFMSVTGHRQTIATAFLLFSVPYIFERKWLRAIMLFIFAISQHKSAVLFGGFLILPFFSNMYRKIILGSFVAFPVMMRAGVDIASLFVDNSFMEQYADFLEEYEGAGAYYFAAFIIFLAVCLLWKGRYLASLNDTNKVFMSAIAVAVALTPLSMINQSNMRIVMYYSIFTLVILPKFLTVYRNSSGFQGVHIVIFWFFALYLFLRPQPYYFFWQ